jgi:hypothetical protein
MDYNRTIAFRNIEAESDKTILERRLDKIVRGLPYMKENGNKDRLNHLLAEMSHIQSKLNQPIKC